MMAAVTNTDNNNCKRRRISSAGADQLEDEIVRDVLSESVFEESNPDPEEHEVEEVEDDGDEADAEAESDDSQGVDPVYVVNRLGQ